MATSAAPEETNKAVNFWPNKFQYNDNQWTIIRLCGQGTFSSCFHICNESGNNLALKVYKKNSKYNSAFLNELEIFGIIRDALRSQEDFAPFFVKCFDSFNLLEHNCVMMELLGYNLNDILVRKEMSGFSPYLVKRSLHDLLSAVSFLKRLHLVHGDIKPTNILWNMNSNCFQVIDFGLSFRIGKQPHDQPLQSPQYQAPEVLQWNRDVVELKLMSDARDINHCLNSAMDLWSIGCVAVNVSIGQHLYAVEQARQLPLLCVNCELNSSPCTHSQKIRTVLSSAREVLGPDDFNNLVDILSGLLQCRPSNRLQPQDALKHSFFIESNIPQPDVVELILLPTKIVRLMNMFEATGDDKAEQEDIICDIKEECEKLGTVISITAGRKSDLQKDFHVYVEFMCVDDAEKAQKMLTGRFFNDRLVIATYFPVKDYSSGHFY